MGMAQTYHPPQKDTWTTVLGTITYPLLKALLSRWYDDIPFSQVIYVMHSNSWAKYASITNWGINKAWGPLIRVPSKKNWGCVVRVCGHQRLDLSQTKQLETLKQMIPVSSQDIKLHALWDVQILNKHTHHKFLTDCKQPRSLAHKRLEAQVTCSFLTIPREEHMTKSKGVGSHLSQSSPIDLNRMKAPAIYTYIHIYVHIYICTYIHMGVSKNRGTPKWMVYNGKPY